MPISLARNGYTHEQVKKMLHLATGSQQIRFRYDVLDKEDSYLGPLDTVIRASIANASLADVKRTAKLELSETTYTQESYITMQDIGHLTMQEIYAKDWSGT